MKTEKMEPEDVLAIGNFLVNYYSDLLYIDNFRKYKLGLIKKDDFIKKGDHSFYDFLIAYRVMRNFKQGEIASILESTEHWIKKPISDDVDSFAEFLKQKGTTHDKRMASLASKILFLNNPWVIQPMDTLARESLKEKTNLYSEYGSKLSNFKTRNKIEIDKCLNSIDSFVSIVENVFKENIKDLETIRYNRFSDILLWTKGQSGKLVI
jgi:hypothetical protein